MSAENPPSLSCSEVEPDDGLGDEGPFSPWLPPDDRLWRHPSEMAAHAASPRSGAGAHPRAAGRMWTIAVLAGLVGALLATGIGTATGAFGRSTTVVRAVTRLLTPNTANALPATPDWSSVYSSLLPSLVSIDGSAANGDVTTAGVVWSSYGSSTYILTDLSIVGSDGPVQVTFGGGVPPVNGQLVGADQETGIAVVKVPGSKRPVADMGTVANLQPGEQVATLEPTSAAMNGPGTVTAGLVSGLDREVHVSNGPTMLGMIGVTGSGSPQQGGPAGGAAVVDGNGAVVGIATSVQSTDAGAATATFAVPIDVAQRIANQLIAGHRPTHPWSGVIQADTLAPAVANQLGVRGGATVDEVMTPSPASQAGIAAGDVITSFNGSPITSAAQLLLATDSSAPNRRVSVGFLHHGKSIQATLVLGTQPAYVTP